MGSFILSDLGIAIFLPSLTISLYYFLRHGYQGLFFLARREFGVPKLDQAQFGLFSSISVSSHLRQLDTRSNFFLMLLILYGFEEHSYDAWNDVGSSFFF